MGYGHYILPDGREAGYAVEATCDEPGCDEPIDRGLFHLCGAVPGGQEDACGQYFCGDHLFIGNRCARCADAIDEDDE